MTTEEFKAEAARLRPQLIREARRYLRDADDAEDVVQDALLRLWQMCPQLRMPMDRLAAVVTRNLAIDRLRRQKLMPTEHADGLPEQATATADDDRDPRLERILSIIDTLPTMQQTILRLRHIEEMEMADIAALIGSTEVAIRKTLSRARQAVRERYFEVKSEK